jgi:hypothetical protein
MRFFSHSIVIITSLVLIVMGQGCAVTKTKVSFDAASFIQPMVLVIDDPRTERRRFGAPGPGYSVSIDYAEDPILSRITKQLVEEYQLIAGDQWPLKSLGVHCILIEEPSSYVMQRLLKDPRVKWVQPFNEFDTQTSDFSLQKSPTLPVLSPTTPLPNHGLGIDIVVIDTGIDRDHPALDASDIVFENFVFDRINSDNEVHGTAVTGLLSARNLLQNNLVKGLVYQANMHHYRGCWQDTAGAGKCSTLTLALALDRAVQISPNVINLSLSGPKDRVLEALVNKLIGQGTVVVSAYDTKRSQDDRFPLPQQGVLYAYGITNETTVPQLENTFLASYSALSLSPNGAYDVHSGHSIATPQISAVTVSLLSKNPDINNHTIVKYLKEWLTIHTKFGASKAQH